MKPTAYHNCLAWHMRCAEPVRRFDRPSRWRWVPHFIISLSGSAFLITLYRFAVWGIWG
jgi:hypothetical protein